jgi:hypothetical protein
MKDPAQQGFIEAHASCIKVAFFTETLECSLQASLTQVGKAETTRIYAYTCAAVIYRTGRPVISRFSHVLSLKADIVRCCTWYP